MKIDYYEILGVERTCNDKEIKTAFRRLAMKYHPDKNPGDKTAEKKFKELGEAYEVLKDPQKRATYDRYGHSAFDGAGMGGAGFGNFSDIFGDMFADIMGGAGFGGQSSSRQNRGDDLRYNMTISLDQAYNGEERNIDIKAAVKCDTCSGSGSADGGKLESCKYCKGRGVQRIQQGFFAIEKPCSHCNGTGGIVVNPCRDCGGSGRKEKKRTIKVNIPRGIDDGTRLRLSGEGEAGLNGGPNGDLYIFINIKEHPIYKREGVDLYCAVPISMTKAALGGSIEVTLLSGKKHLIKIPVGIQNGKKLCLRGEGMPLLQRSSYGNLYIQLNVETPQNLNAKQTELLKEFEALSKNDNSPTSSGFFNKMRDFFKHL